MLRLLALLAMALPMTLGDARRAHGQETDQVIQSIVQTVRDDVRRRVKQRENQTVASTAGKSGCQSCLKARAGKKRVKQQ